MTKKDILDKLAEEVDKIDNSSLNQSSSLSGAATKTKKSSQTISTKKDSLAKEKTSKMKELLEKSPVKLPQEGEVVKGKVIEVFSNYALIDLENYKTGIVLGKEMKDGLSGGVKLKVGDEVTATVMDLEDENGYVELSIREASYEKAWDDLESKKDNKDTVKTKILDANRGGLMVEINGITGFLPVSQLSSDHYPRVEDGDKNKILELLKELVGKEINVRILDANREEEKLIVSEKAAISDEEKEVISQLKVGDVVEGEISGVVDFGAFVKFDLPSKKKSLKKEKPKKLEGLVHISELAWQLIDDPKQVVKVGDKIKAEIIGIEDMRISLSMRSLMKDPWKDIEKKYKIGKVYPGKVDKINHFGAFVYLDDDIHGLAHLAEFSEMYPGKKLHETIQENKTYNWKIISMEPAEHRMGLVLILDEEKTKDKKKKTKEEKVKKTKAKKTEKKDNSKKKIKKSVTQEKKK